MRDLPPPPGGLAERGAQLWREMHEDRERGPDERVLIVEACRMVDRLDVLDAAMRGDLWMRLDEVPDSNRWVVVVDQVAGEARRTAAALKQLIGELRLQHEPGVVRGGVAPPPAPVEETLADDTEHEEATRHDELSARRSAGTRRVPDPAG